MNKNGKKDLLWAYGSQLLYSGMNIFILPIVLRKLTKYELGLWYTFTAIGTITSMLDMGFLSTILRSLTYAWNGATSISKDGIEQDVVSGKCNYLLFFKVISITKILYLLIGLFAFILCISFGSIYIYNISNNLIPFNKYFPSWIVYILSITINIYYSFWTPVLRSVGGIRQSYQIIAISKILQIIFSIIGLLLGYGLLAIAFAYLFSNFFIRYASKIIYEKNSGIKDFLHNNPNIYFSFSEKKELFLIMWPNAYKQWLISLSKFLTSKFSILICSGFLGLNITSQFGLTGQIYGIFITLANVMLNVYSPTIGGLYIKNDKQNLYSVFTMTLGFQFLFLLFSGIGLSISGNWLLNILKAKSSLIPVPALYIYILYVIILNSFDVESGFIALGNKVPMYKARIISSIVTVILQLIFCKFLSNIGIWCILFPQIIILLSYNGWKWIKYIADYFNKGFLQIHIDSLVNIKNLFIKYNKITEI